MKGLRLKYLQQPENAPETQSPGRTFELRNSRDYYCVSGRL